MKLSASHRIVIADDAPAPVRTAANELRSHLRAVAGGDLPVVPASVPGDGSEILVGDSPRLRALAPELAAPGLREEEHVLRTAGHRLILTGGGRRGTLYAVFSFLREHLGCRWFTPDCAVVPRRQAIELPPLDERRAPAYEYRHFILTGVDDPAWAARNGYNGYDSPDDPAWGGHVAHWHYGHSLHALCPAERYFAGHPEYFDSTSRRKRVVDDYVNLCFTNDDVVRIVVDNMRRAMADSAARRQAGARLTPPTVFYLAQNDGGTPCACPACRKIIAAEGARSAALIHFCNRVVEAMGDEFPDFRMMTIAYRFSRRPPRRLRPHPKLIVQLCTIECCQAHPYATCDDPDDARFREDLAGWRALTGNLWVWDYMPRLWHPFLTGPGFDAMAANYRWFRENGVRGMFTQTGGERDFKWLNAWLMCQMMRDPYQDWSVRRDEFMGAYYGPAAAPLREFLAAVQDSVVAGGHHLHYKEGTVKPFFSPAVIAAGDRLFADAAAAVRQDPTRAARVREEFMHFLATKLQHACLDSVRHGCSLRHGRYVFARPPPMRREVGLFTSWRDERFAPAGTRGRPDSEGCTLHLESDLVALDNGTLELEFLPRLAGRMVGLRHQPAGHNFMHSAPCTNGQFNPDNGYREEWLTAPAPYEQEGSSSWSRRQGTGAGTAEAGYGASVAAGAPAGGQVFETGGKFMHPLQWERWTRLAVAGGAFHIESMIVNRGTEDVDATVETVLPLDLGPVAEVTVGGAAGEASARSATLTAVEAEKGLRIVNRRRGLGLAWRAAGEIIREVRLEVDASAGRLTLRIRTRPEILTPGAGRRFCQFMEVLT